MRKVLWVLATVAAIGCGGDPLCGVNEETGEDIPICVYEAQGVELPFEFCPGDTWSDGCDTFACDADGQQIKTSNENCQTAG
jgi:hypothetical protein